MTLDPAAVQAAFTRVREHFLTQDGQPRKQLAYAKADFATERDPFLEANLSALAFSLIDLRALEGLFAVFFVALGFAFAFVAMRRGEL